MLPAGFSNFTSTNPTNWDPALPDQALPEQHSVIQRQQECPGHAGAPAEMWPGWLLACVPRVPLLPWAGGLESPRRAGSKPISDQPKIKRVGSAPSAPAVTILLRAASCPKEPSAEHPAILPCKEHGIVPNSAVLTLPVTTTTTEKQKEKKQTVKAGLKRTSK